MSSDKNNKKKKHGNTDKMVTDPITEETENTKKRAADSQTTKAKEAKKKTPIYFSFELKNGLDDEHIEGLQARNEFLSGYKDLVVRTHNFTSKDRWIAFKTKREKEKDKQVSTTPTKPNPPDSPTTSTSPTASDQAAADRILANMNATADVERFHGYYRCTSNSTVFVLLFKLLLNKQKEFWGFKPDIVCPILKGYATEAGKPTDPHIQEACRNLKFARERDTTSNEPDKAKVNMYTPPKTTKEIPLDIHMAYTSITIPHDKFSTAEQEKEWIQDIAFKFWTYLKQAMLSKTFQLCISTVRPNWVKTLFNQNHTGGLHQFLKRSVFRLEKIDSVATYIVASDAAEINTILWNNRTKTPKYANTQIQEFPIEDNEDESETST
jgi:hypothetical protein